MGQKRLRGDTSIVRLAQNGKTAEATWNAVVDFDFSSENDILEEEYLGEPCKRYDGIFNGFKGKANTHAFSDAEHTLEEAINDKNARKSFARFDIVIVMTYPSGKVVVRTMEDVEFGTTQTTYGGRKDYVKVAFEFASSSMSRHDQ